MSVSVLNTTSSLSGKTLAKLEDTQTFTGQKTFDVGASAPFVVVSGAAKVANLDADKLDGAEGSAFHDAAQLTGLTPAASVFVEQTTTLTGANNDVAPSAGAFILIRCTGAAPVFTGFTGGATGRKLRLLCLGTTLKVSDQTGSSAANQIICASTQGQIVGVGGVIDLDYDATTARWRASLVDAGAPITFTPTWAGGAPAIGNGTLTGRYSQAGKLVYVEIYLLAGGTTTFGAGTYTWSVPLTAASASRGGFSGIVTDAGTGIFIVTGTLTTTTTMLVYSTAGASGSAVPMTWANGDSLEISGTYAIT